MGYDWWLIDQYFPEWGEVIKSVPFQFLSFFGRFNIPYTIVVPLIFLLPLVLFLFNRKKIVQKDNERNSCVITPVSVREIRRKPKKITSILRYPVFLVTFVFFISITIVLLLYVNSVINSLSGSGIQWETRTYDPSGKTGGFESISIGTILVYGFICVLYYLKTFFILPGMYKLIINCNKRLAITRRNFIKVFSGLFLIVNMGFQLIINQTYFRFSLLSVWIWICFLFTIGIYFDSMKKETKRINNSNKLFTFTGFLRAQLKWSSEEGSSEAV